MILHNYCSHCEKSSKYLDEIDVLDVERRFNAEFNDDCVFAFRINVDNDDVVSTAQIIISITCNIVYDKLPDKSFILNNVIIPIDMYVPDPQPLDAIVPYELNVSVSNKNNVSDDISDCEFLNEYTKKLIENGSHDVKKKKKIK